jgi:hypothetical protein
LLAYLNIRVFIASTRQNEWKFSQLVRLGQRLNSFTAFAAVGTTVGTMELSGARKKKGLRAFLR